jgi:chemotaxis response regulator CheB
LCSDSCGCKYSSPPLPPGGFVAANGIVAIGASAGGVESLRRLVRGLPANLPAAVAVVLHLAPNSRSMLAQILSRSGALPAHQASDRCRLEDGHIYVAAPDHHLLVEDHQLRVTRGATENGVRPAVDPLSVLEPLGISLPPYGSCVRGTRRLGDASAWSRC